MNTIEHQLSELRKVCEAATPGPWKSIIFWNTQRDNNFYHLNAFSGRTIARFAYDPEPNISRLPLSSEDEANVRHCEAFSPSQVLRLLRALEIAGEALDFPNKVLPSTSLMSTQKKIEMALNFFDQWLKCCDEARAAMFKELAP